MVRLARLWTLVRQANARAVALRATGRHGEHWHRAVQRLDGRLLVHAEDDGVLRGVQIRPDHVRRPLLEVRVVRRQASLQPVRPEIRSRLGPVHDRVPHLQVFSQPSGAPVRRAIGRRGPGHRQDLRLHLRGQNRRRGAWRLAGREGRHAALTQPLAPLVDEGGRAIEPLLHADPRLPACQQEDELRVAGILLPDGSGPSSSFRLAPFGRRQDDALSVHAPQNTSFLISVQPTRGLRHSKIVLGRRLPGPGLRITTLTCRADDSSRRKGSLRNGRMRNVD